MGTSRLTLRDRIAWAFIRPFRERKRVKGCKDFICRHDMPHRPCTDCGTLTDRSTIRVESGTLRRRKAYACDSCQRGSAFADDRFRKQRAKKDWRELTDPIAEAGIRLGELPEQIPGPTRAMLRAFYESDDNRAVVEDSSASTLNQSISALGLDDEIYAETRGLQTVLRKVESVRRGRR